MALAARLSSQEKHLSLQSPAKIYMADHYAKVIYQHENNHLTGIFIVSFVNLLDQTAFEENNFCYEMDTEVRIFTSYRPGTLSTPPRSTFRSEQSIAVTEMSLRKSH